MLLEGDWHERCLKKGRRVVWSEAGMGSLLWVGMSLIEPDT